VARWAHDKNRCSLDLPNVTAISATESGFGEKPQQELVESHLHHPPKTSRLDGNLRLHKNFFHFSSPDSIGTLEIVDRSFPFTSERVICPEPTELC